MQVKASHHHRLLQTARTLHFESTDTVVLHKNPINSWGNSHRSDDDDEINERSTLQKEVSVNLRFRHTFSIQGL